MDQQASTLIQRKVETLQVNASVMEVGLALAKNQHTFVPIVDESNKCIGVISSQDLIDFNASGADAGIVKAWEICSHKLVHVAPSITASDAGATMLEQNIHHLLVCDEEGHVTGVISSLDVIRSLLSR